MRGEKSRRNAQTLTQSWTMRIGSMIAAARTGDTASDRSGIDRSSGPENPPFDRPSRITAGIGDEIEVAVRPTSRAKHPAREAA